MFPEFDETEKLELRSQVQRAINGKQRETVESIRNGIVSGDPGTDDAGIDRMAEGARLGAEDVAALKDFRKKLADAKTSAAPLDREAVAALFGEISKYAGDEKTDPLAATWGSLVQRAEVLTAAGGREGSLTRGALMQSLYARHPFQQRRQEDVDVPEGIERKFSATIEAVAADAGFGVDAYRVEKKRGADASGNPVFTGEFEVRPNPWAAKRRVQVQADLWEALKADFKANPDKWNDPGYLDEWLFGKDGKGGKLGMFKAGAAVEKMRAGGFISDAGATSAGPHSILPAPVGTYGDPLPSVDDLNNILDPLPLPSPP